MTSANRSGTPPLTTCADLQATFGELVAVYLCDERPLEGASSTVSTSRTAMRGCCARAVWGWRPCDDYCPVRGRC